MYPLPYAPHIPELLTYGVWTLQLTSAAKSGDAATDECVGLFTPDKDRCTADGMGRAAVIAARRGTVCGEVGRVPRFRQLTVHTLYEGE